MNQQRIRQYAGGHDETWGEVTLNIDANVAHGPVADLTRGQPFTTTVVVEEPVLRSLAQTGGAEALMQLKAGLEEMLRQQMPVVTQLGSWEKEEQVESGFLI